MTNLIRRANDWKGIGTVLRNRLKAVTFTKKLIATYRISTIALGESIKFAQLFSLAKINI